MRKHYLWAGALLLIAAALAPQLGAATGAYILLGVVGFVLTLMSFATNVE